MEVTLLLFRKKYIKLNKYMSNDSKPQIVALIVLLAWRNIIKNRLEIIRNDSPETPINKT